MVQKKVGCAKAFTTTHLHANLAKQHFDITQATYKQDHKSMLKP